MATQLLTTEQHEKIVGNRFTLTHIIIKRTKQLMNGAPLSKEVREKFNIHRYDDIPNHLMPKIVLEEIRMGLLTWRDPANDKPSQDVSKIVGVNEVVYGG